MFFNDWETIWRTFIIGIFAYAGLLLVLRISGKRTLSKMDAFDLVVTVALGSTLATILLSKTVALAEGLTAYVILVLLQFIIAFSSVKLRAVRRIIKADPAFLYRDGRYLEEVMKKKRIVAEEILQAAISNGISSMSQVEAVVLEPDGSLSVIKKAERTGQSTLENVKDSEIQSS